MFYFVFLRTTEIFYEPHFGPWWRVQEETVMKILYILIDITSIQMKRKELTKTFMIFQIEKNPLWLLWF